MLSVRAVIIMLPGKMCQPAAFCLLSLAVSCSTDGDVPFEIKTPLIKNRGLIKMAF